MIRSNPAQRHRLHRPLSVAALCCLATVAMARDRPPASKPDRSALSVAFRTPLLVNGVTTAAARTFAPFQRQDGAATPEVGEIAPDGQIRPFPDAAWNGWRPGDDPAAAFVAVNALRVGPDGALWVVDTGAAHFGAATLPGGPKLVRIDLRTDRVARRYDLTSVAAGTSLMDDVRFNGRHAYITDAGRAGLVVLDLDSGIARRVLDDHPALRADGPATASMRVLNDGHGRTYRFEADQLEVSPDGRWLYVQPASGGFSRIATRLLDDPATPPEVLASNLRHVAATFSTGGTAMDAAGNIYLSDKDRARIVRLTPTGRQQTLVQDARLDWVDAMWIDDAGNLLMPASQLDRIAALNGGRDATAPPFTVYRLPLHVQPLRR